MTKTEFEAAIEQFRPQLTGYCYRMLGSPFEAEDAVQEILLRAWERIERLEHDAALRTWLYRIATRVCLDVQRSRQRRALPVDLAGPAAPGEPLGPPAPEAAWIGPVPDHRVLTPSDDPAEMVVARESVRLAFIAALQRLAPKQRAVLILRDVLQCKAHEVAAILETSVAAVNSALQRARTAISSIDREGARVYLPDDEAQRALLARYVDAFERNDVDALVALLHEDATMSMPPFTWWIRGRDAIGLCLSSSDACRGAKLVPTVACGSPAFGQYRQRVRGGPYEPFALVHLDLVAERIAGITNFLYGNRLFSLFNLPLAID